MEAAAKTNGFTVKVTEPFDRENPPKALDVDQNFTKAAFGLTPEDPFAQPVGGKDGVYIIAYNNKIPSEIPSLEKIRDRVTADYKFMKAAQLARTAGLEFEKARPMGWHKARASIRWLLTQR